MAVWSWRRQFEDFPKPVKLNNRLLYPEDEAVAFMERRRGETV